MLYIVIFCMLLVVEFCYIKLAPRYGIIDKPIARSSHIVPTINGGGIIFPLAAWIYAAFEGFAYPYFYSGLTILAAISFKDDMRSLSSTLRLTAQFIAMSLLAIQLGIAQTECLPLVLLFIIVGSGILNIYNFMDGINGITGAYSLAVLLPLVYLNKLYSIIPQSFILFIIISLLVFCLFNFRKNALCFAGDVGAVSMAFILIFLIGMLIVKTNDYTYLMLLAVYGVDSTLTIIHRLMLRENIFCGHRKHAYQIMTNELGFSHLTVSLAYALVQICISTGLIMIRTDRYLYSAAVLIILSILYVGFIKKNYHLVRTDQ